MRTGGSRLTCRTLAACAMALAATAGCAAPPGGGPNEAAVSAAGPSYQREVAYLHGKTPIIGLKEAAGRIAVAPELQGRVMVSSFSPNGPSLGWINREAIDQGQRDIPFNDYGGQDRIWLGPEGGPFALFFDQGDPQNLDTWRAADAMHKGAFRVLYHDDSSVRMRGSMKVVNACGTEIHVKIERTVRSIPRAAAERLLDVEVPEAVAYVGFVSENRLTNIGPARLTTERGTVSIWSIGQFPAHDRTVVIAPYRKKGEGNEVRIHYCDQLGPERLVVDRQAGVVLFRADGRCHSKIGLGPGQATDRLGSIDLDRRLLTIVHFDRTPGAAKYVNSGWGVPQAEPFAGDVTNAYNSGDQSGQRVYGLESSSPAALVAPGASWAHHQRTLQFQGPIEALSKISEKVLGVGLESVQRQMP